MFGMSRSDRSVLNALYDIVEQQNKLLNSMAAVLLEDHKLMSKISDEIANLKSEVANLQQVVPGVTAALQGVAQQMNENANDAAAIRELANSVHTQAGSIAQAIVQGTPAAASASATSATADPSSGSVPPAA